MYLIVGLGNPEKEYSGTRHNMGFCAVNELAKKNNIEINKEKFEALYGSGLIEGKKVLFIKPQTFMNLSGRAVKSFMDFYKIDIEKLIIIYDDMDINPGNIRIRKQGTAGGHNGIKSIIKDLNTTNFSRIRIGIGRPKYEDDYINYVINKVSKEELEELQGGINKAVYAIEEILKNNIETAMNKFNWNIKQRKEA